ncbi:MAG: glycoside hydrolase family 1 protein [Candidatus Yanofskybacteria bacterium]|nr:glycoside hydrolase family 1 protein [Candidatus Yanofskybacteria bacterium]
MVKNFPKNFLWGSATSSYQVEGGIENNDWASCCDPKLQWASLQNFAMMPIVGGVPCAGRATDHYNLYEKDFDIAKKLNHNAHRFSIEWSRIEPEEGKFDEKEIEHYRKVLQALRDRGIEPFVTLWHFTLPTWFAKIGGFENPKAPEIFARYCGFVVGRLAASAKAMASQEGTGAKFWMTINEPMVYASKSYLKGVWPPFKRNFFAFKKVIKTLISSHLASHNMIKKINPELQVGIAKNNIYTKTNWNPLNQIICQTFNWFWNLRFLNAITGFQDFIGLNYYHHFAPGIKEDLEKTEYMNWEIYPKGIYHLLRDLKRYNLPIYITENGLADAKDTKREKFIKDHLRWVWQAIQDGVDVRGYFYWSLLDNFEWTDGFGPRFGLVEIDYETMERKIRPSAWEYAEICKNNQIVEFNDK